MAPAAEALQCCLSQNGMDDTAAPQTENAAMAAPDGIPAQSCRVETGAVKSDGMEKPPVDDLIRELFDVYSLLFKALDVVTHAKTVPFKWICQLSYEVLDFEADHWSVFTLDGDLHEDMTKRYEQLAELIADMMYEPEPETES